MARDLLVNVIGGIVVAILLGLVAFLWDGMFASLWATSRVSFVLLCVAFLVIGLAAGFAIGWGVRGRRIDSEAAKVADSEREMREKADEDERREEEEREVAELEKLNGFNMAQLKFMIHCFCEESMGHAGLKGRCDDVVANDFADNGILTAHSAGDYDHYVYVLTPEWRSYVEAHENDMRAMLGLDLREGGLPSEEDVESHLQYLHSKAYA